MDPVLQEINQKIADGLEHLKKDLAGIRAGRANPALLEDIPVAAYDTKMKLVELGTISAPQPSLLTIQVWDPALVKDVEKAILETRLGLNPGVDGQTVRVPLPPLTQERREEFIKLTHSKGEETRVQIRQLRQEQKDDLEEDLKNKDISEDEYERLKKQLQDLVDKASLQVDELVKEKEISLREI